MALYIYKASDRSGKTIDGTMEARDESVVVDKLHDLGYFPLDISLPEAAQGLSTDLTIERAIGSVRSKDIMMFTRELATLLLAGLTLEGSLNTIVEISDKKKFRNVTAQVLADLRGGKSFSEALAKHPKVFSKLYVNMVRAGEAGGVLEAVLDRLSTFLEDAQELKEYIVSAMLYPIILTAVGGAAVAILITMVIPKFAQIFADQGKALPLPTQIILSISSFMTDYWWALAASLAAIIAFFKIYSRSENGRFMLDSFKLGLPIFGPLIEKIEIGRLARTLGTLIKNGVPLLQALGIVKESATNTVLAEAVVKAREKVKGGSSLTEPLRQSRFFPPLFLQMLSVGEETGNLDGMLIRAADLYDRHVKTTVKRLISLLEPVMILVMGGIVAFIVLSMLLAIFSINELPF